MKLGIALALAMLSGGAAIAQTPPAWEPYSAGLQSRAAAGDPAAQTALGEAFRTGNGIGPDREQAIAWYRRAATRDTRAADALGVLLFTKGERKEAMPLLQGAALRRNAYALYILGTARFNGDYVPKDLCRAYADMRIAAETLPQAQRSLGLMEPYITAIDRSRADQLAALPGGPEAGAVTAPAYALASPPPPRPAPVVTRPAPSPAVASTPVLSRTSPPPPVRPALRIDTPADDTPAPAPLPKRAVTRPAPLVTKPAAVTSAAPTGAFRVQLGAYGSQERADGQWKALLSKLPGLKGLQKATAPVGALIRLQATGIATRDQAAAICDAAAEINAPCLVLSQ